MSENTDKRVERRKGPEDRRLSESDRRGNNRTVSTDPRRTGSPDRRNTGD